MSDQATLCLLRPDTKVIVKQHTIVLIEDLVSDQFPDLKDIVPLSYRDKIAIFCSYKNLCRVREEFPGLPAYGIWQLLFASRYQFTENLYAVYFDTERQNGQFLLNTDNQFVSGKIVHGKALDVVNHIDLQTAKPIELTVDDLNLPDDPALTAEERDRINVRNKKRAILSVTAGAVSAVLIFTAVSLHVDSYYQQHETQKLELLNELEALEIQRDEIVASRIRQWPKQWSTLYPLARLDYTGVPFSVQATDLGYSAMNVRLISDPETGKVEIPTWIYALPEVNIKPQMDGSVQINWLNKQGKQQ